jgi:hypothetical protein
VWGGTGREKKTGKEKTKRKISETVADVRRMKK